MSEIPEAPLTPSHNPLQKASTPPKVLKAPRKPRPQKLKISSPKLKSIPNLDPKSPSSSFSISDPESEAELNSETTLKEKNQNSGQKPKKASRQPKTKRGPARPHRRIPLDIINTRIIKLEKRFNRAKNQAEDAHRHLEGYKRERDFRVDDEKKPVEAST